MSLSAAFRSMTQSDDSFVGRERPSVVGLSTRSYGLSPSQRSFPRVSNFQEPSFQGPTTSAFSFDLAKSSLQRRGIVERKETTDEGNLTQEPSPLASPSAPHRDLGLRKVIDPVWSLSKSEALRLCQVYEEEMGIMYPVLELPELLNQVHLLYDTVDHTIASDSQLDGNHTLHREDVYILRLVFACALTAEASGRSEQAIALFDSVREVQDNCVWGPPEIKSIILLTLVVRRRQRITRQSTDNFLVNILLSNGRRNVSLADDRDCRAHVPRERATSTRNTQPAGNSDCWKRPSATAVLVNLHSGHTVELWNRYAIRTGVLGY